MCLNQEFAVELGLLSKVLLKKNYIANILPANEMVNVLMVQVFKGRYIHSHTLLQPTWSMTNMERMSQNVTARAVRVNTNIRINHHTSRHINHLTSPPTNPHTPRETSTHRRRNENTVAMTIDMTRREESERSGCNENVAILTKIYMVSVQTGYCQKRPLHIGYC